jgi:hypothetical protein
MEHNSFPIFSLREFNAVFLLLFLSYKICIL